MLGLLETHHISFYACCSPILNKKPIISAIYRGNFKKLIKMYTKEQRGIACNELPHSSWWINEKWQFHWKLLSLVFFFCFEKPNLAHSRVFLNTKASALKKALKDVYNCRRAINHLILKRTGSLRKCCGNVAWCVAWAVFRYISWASRWTRNFPYFQH